MNAPADLLAMFAATHRLAVARGVPCFLVGGFLRDALLGRAPRVLNIDLAVPAGALDFAQALARALGGHYVCLDEHFGSARVVVPGDVKRVELDCSDFRGSTIEEDLARRDVTINALALPLAAWHPARDWTAALIDPLQGRAHLRAKRLVPCYADTFTEDPIRILRVARFAAELECAPTDEARALMREAVAGLQETSGERLRHELLAALETPRAGGAVRMLDDIGALVAVCPELAAGREVSQGGYHHLDVLNHQLEAVAQCDRILHGGEPFSEDLERLVAAYVTGELIEQRSRRALMKLSALLHDVGKPATRRVKPDGDVWFIGHEHFGATLVEGIAERLKLSNRETQMVERIVRHHLRPGHLSREPQLTRRAIFRFFRDLEDDGPACLLVWWADRLATRGPLSRIDQIDQQRSRLEELLRAYFLKPEEAVRPPRLLDGRDLMKALGLPPGPEIGRLLKAIEEAQAAGEIRSHDDALALARRLRQGA